MPGAGRAAGSPLHLPANNNTRIFSVASDIESAELARKVDHAAIVMAAGDQIAHGEAELLDFHRRQVVGGLNGLVVGDFDKADNTA